MNFYASLRDRNVSCYSSELHNDYRESTSKSVINTCISGPITDDLLNAYCTTQNFFKSIVLHAATMTKDPSIPPCTVTIYCSDNYQYIPHLYHPSTVSLQYEANVISQFVAIASQHCFPLIQNYCNFEVKHL